MTPFAWGLLIGWVAGMVTFAFLKVIYEMGRAAEREAGND